MKPIIFLLVILIAYSTFNYITSPILEVEVINGKKTVISVNGIDSFRPLTVEDELESRIIYIKGEK